ncbi:MAG: hypothetical protein KGL04_08830 [Elusimicrobia bacterium]|nr:hypothetical protein [Elusimicrobiota bacterium]MDE2314265.1 hypothetical protein [Elusimicrobiota bacterium]
MKRFIRAALALSLCLAPVLAQADECALPVMAVAGAATPGSSGEARLSAGVVSGTASSAFAVMSLGLQSASAAAYSCFMSTAAPAEPLALPGTSSTQSLVPSPQQTMTLEWTQGPSPLPVSYEIDAGNSPYALSSVASGLTSASYELSGLAFTTPYYWQVKASDQFGRVTASPVYSFSITQVPSSFPKAYNYPNPFSPERGGTNIVFHAPASGYQKATVEIYSEWQDLLFKQDYYGIPPGVSQVHFDGRDRYGRDFFDGSYICRVTFSGPSDSQTFYLLVVK